MIYVQYNEYHDLYEKTSINEIEKTGLLGKKIVHKIVTATVTINATTGDLMVVDQNGLSWLYPFLEHLNEDEIRVLRTMGSDWYNVHGLVGVGFSEDKAKKIIDRLAQVGAVGLRRGYRCD